ncbi:GAF domain-containing protein [Celeribacter neptunius]|uniref:GAF domain-containing protein n=1 Tax=Celeribacter neptunius TaxID=588602 RepID=A0A1I3JVC6_9RHOB|nr:GAF domain-containing protein [Celeribacter neptunius]SFI64211.1 GAF domain-containing protein [Celeribacter neptunius]
MALELHGRVAASGVLIYRAIPSEAGVLLKVLAATNQPVAHRLDNVLLPENTIGNLVMELNREIVINDTLTHPLVKDSGAVSIMGIMAYIGVPARLDGRPFGGVSVVDQHRRHWTEAEVLATRVAAAQLEALALERRNAMP